jgi:hypothetical protein
MNLSMPMKLRLKSGDYIDHPIMFLSLGGLWPQVVQQQFLTLIWQMEMQMVVEPLEMVVQGHPIIWIDDIIIN